MRFALLYHRCPPEFGKPSHWDLLIEHEGQFDAWNLRTLPADWQAALACRGAVPGAAAAGPQCGAWELPPHRLEYFDYEGPVSGDRGAVQRFDRGFCRVAERDADRVVVHLEGAVLRGEARLQRCGLGSAEWLLTVVPG